MTWWEILGVSLAYAACGLVCARLIAGHLAYSWHEARIERTAREYASYHITAPEPAPSPNGYRWFGGWCLGLLLGLIWPAAVIASTINLEGMAVGAEARAVRRRQAERITELEREAGIR